MRSEVGSCCPFCERIDGSGSSPRPGSLRMRNPRFTDPSGFMLPRSPGGDWRSGSGEPMELFATSIAWEPCAAGTTRFRRLMIDFFIVTGRWTPWSL